MAGEQRPTIRVAVGGPIRPADLPALCSRVRELLESSPGADVACDLSAAAADATTVDALARLVVATRRHGCRLAVTGLGDDLRRLIDFMGLEDVLPR